MKINIVAISVGVAALVGCATQANSSPAEMHSSLDGEKVGEVFAKPGRILTRIGREFPAFDTMHCADIGLQLVEHVRACDDGPPLRSVF